MKCLHHFRSRNLSFIIFFLLTKYPFQSTFLSSILINLFMCVRVLFFHTSVTLSFPLFLGVVMHLLKSNKVKH